MRDRKREDELLQRLDKRKKALEQYEKAKRKQSRAQEEKNIEKMEMTKKCEEKRQEDIRDI